jgi:hypothetical protein
MSTDTPRPERVTLSDEERARVREYAAFWWQRETGETDEWAGLAAEEREAVIENSYAETVVDWLAAREQALREEIAREIEGLRTGIPGMILKAVDDAYSYAARIARGGAR